MFEWIPRTLIGFLAPVGGADGVDLAGFALGQVKVLSRKVHCMSLSSIHILYNHTPAAPLRPHPELCCGLIIFLLIYAKPMIGGSLRSSNHLYLVVPGAAPQATKCSQAKATS